MYDFRCHGNARADDTNGGKPGHADLANRKKKITQKSPKRETKTTEEMDPWVEKVRKGKSKTVKDQLNREENREDKAGGGRYFDRKSVGYAGTPVQDLCDGESSFTWDYVVHESNTDLEDCVQGGGENDRADELESASVETTAAQIIRGVPHSLNSALHQNVNSLVIILGYFSEHMYVVAVKNISQNSVKVLHFLCYLLSVYIQRPSEFIARDKPTKNK